MASDEDISLRNEALRAFAHEIRTPLTSVRMVLALAKQDGSSALVLDGELAAILSTSLDELQSLADDIQEMSRLERGTLVPARGPSDLRAAFLRACELAAPDLAFEGDVPAASGPWDAARLAQALAGLAGGANRLGDGSGVVRVACEMTPVGAKVSFESGEVGGESRPVGAEAGYAFFRARLTALSLGADVECDRRAHGCRVALLLRA